MLAGGMALDKSLCLPGLSFPHCEIEIIITAANQNAAGELNRDEVTEQGLTLAWLSEMRQRSSGEMEKIVHVGRKGRVGLEAGRWLKS